MTDLISPAAAGVELGVSEKTLAKWRQAGKGPPFVRIAHDCVRYPLRPLREWRANQLVTVRYLSLSAAA